MILTFVCARTRVAEEIGADRHLARVQSVAPRSGGIRNIGNRECRKAEIYGGNKCSETA